MKKVLIMKNALLVFAGILFFIASCKKEPTRIPVNSIAITSSSLNLSVGGTQQLTATISPTNATTKSVTWSSSDPTKATVDATGKVTGVATGIAAISATATDGSYTDGSYVKGTVTVNVVTVKATSIAITPATPSVGVAGNITLTAAVTPSDAVQTVLWVSSDPTKATVDATTGKVTGVGIGTTTIVAIAIDGTSIVGKTTLTVTSNAAILSAITLGDENFNVDVPASGGTTPPLANAPRTFWATPKAVKVNLKVSDNAVIQIGSTTFTSGNTVDFTNSVTFKVTAQDGVTTNSYTVAITAYNATSNPYGIYSVKHLVDVKNGLGESYLMKNNIDLPYADAAGETATGIDDYAQQGWSPLGGSEISFTGTFNGGNFVINNFYTRRYQSVVGLFGIVGGTGTIKNLGVNGKSGMAIASSEHERTPYRSSGILAGENEGTIDHCFATGNISNSYDQPIAGGLVGGNNGTITNSYATGSVTANSNATNVLVKVYAGGLVGIQTNGGRVNNCYALGNSSASTLSTNTNTRVYGGGLIGYTEGAISNSYATGDVSVSSSSDNQYVGGLVGYRKTSGNAGGGTVVVGANTTGATITNCYRNSSAAITKNNDSVTPDDTTTAGVTAKTETEMQADTFIDNLNGSSGTTWGRTSGNNEGFPFIIGVGVGK